MFFMKKPQQLSNRQIQPGETLFQYLKRKKQIALRESVEKELVEIKHLRQVQNPSDNSVAIKQRQVQKQGSQQSANKKNSTKRKQRKSTNKKKKMENSFESSKNSTKQKQNNFSLINVLNNDIFKDDRTTKRAALHKNDSWNIMEQKEPEQNNKTKRSKSPFRSFISMISPLKNRIENPLSNLSNTKIFTKQNLDDEKRRQIIKTTEISTKKIIKQAINKVQKRYNKQIQFESSMIQKIREFILLVNSFLIHIEDELLQDENIQKKLTQVRSTIKLLNSYIQTHLKQQKQSGDISEQIDSLYGQLSHVLDQYEIQVSKNSQLMKQSEIQRVKQQLQFRIQQLTKQKTRLTREISSLNKQSIRMQKAYNNLLQDINHLNHQIQQQSQQNKRQSQSLKASFEDQINELTTKNINLRQSLEQLTKLLKNTEYNLDQYKRKINSEKQDKTSARQSYLLKQITLVKEDCAKDIESISNFYKTKLEQYPEKITAIELQRQEQKVKIYSLTEKILSLQNAIKLSESQRLQARQKLQDSLVDMCKINEELFRHWLALKDVKTLSLRLGVFDKFERIYRDVPFDDAMFLL